MNKKLIYISIFLLFVAGISLGKSILLLGIILSLLSFLGFYFGLGNIFSSKNNDEDDNCECDEPPLFVRKEVLEGSTDTSMRVLSQDYKRKIRYEIEEVIVESLSNLLDVMKEAVPFHTAAFLRRGNTDVVYLFLYKSDSKSVLLGEPIGYGAGLVGQIVKDKQGRVICEGDICAPSTTLQYYGEDESIKSFLGVPVVVQGECRGALILDSKKRNAFGENAKKTVESFARIAGTIQYYSYLQLENKIDRNKVTALSSLQRKFFQLGTELEIIEELGDILKSLLRSERITVSLEDGDNEKGCISYVNGYDKDYFKNYTFPFREKGLISLVFDKNSVIKREFDIGRYVPRFSVREKVNTELKSILAVPIPSSNNGKCLGVISLESISPNHYSQIDTENIQNLATATGLALEKIKMLNAQTHLATIDGLTSLPNHRHFQNHLESSFKRARRQNSELAVLLTDIDYFKKVNDTYGHPVGDKILRGVADIIKGSIRKDVDFAARYGGEEFACVLESGESMALETGERIRSQIENATFDIGGGKTLKITMSIGAAIYPTDSTKKQQLVKLADKALYTAKDNGRNKVCKY